MKDLSSIPIDILLNDLCAAAFDMGVSKIGLAVAEDLPPAVLEDLQSRYDENERQAQVIKTEITSRIGE